MIASDIDPVAAHVAARNADINEVSDLIATVVSAGFDHLLPEDPYDLVVANILAEPLIELAPHIGNSVDGKGRVVLSGLLATEVDRVAEVYKTCGLEVADSIGLRDWVTLVLFPILR